MQSEEQAVAIAARDGEIRELRKQLVGAWFRQLSTCVAVADWESPLLHYITIQDAAKRFEEKTEALGVVVATKEGEISELKKQLVGLQGFLPALLVMFNVSEHRIPC